MASAPDEVSRYTATLRKKHPNREDEEIARMARDHLSQVPPATMRDVGQGRKPTLAQWTKIDRIKRYELYAAAYDTARTQLELAGYPQNRNVATETILTKMKQQLSYRADYPLFPDVVLQEAVGRAKVDMLNSH